MKKALALFSLLSLTGAGCIGFGAKSNVEVTTPPVGTVKPEGAMEAKSSLAASDQKPGTLLIIDNVVFGKPGFVAIHADVNGAPGPIIANSSLLQVGTTNNVVVKLATSNNATYWAMLHTDNGDGVYVTSDDLPIKEESGAIVMMRFVTKTDATVDAKAILNLNGGTDTNVNVDVGVTIKTHAITMQSFAFSNTSLTVKRGDKVTFTNKDAVAHTSTADKGAWDSGNIAVNGSFTLDTSALAAGTYSYHCTPHPNMKGTIIVQ